VNNNGYLKVKIAQIDAQRKTLQAELKQLGERRKAYEAQLVDEPQPETPGSD
jgi:hypothetical protein